MSIKHLLRSKTNRKSCELSEKSVTLQRVFHSIRFKVNKGWVTAVTLIFLPKI